MNNNKISVLHVYPVWLPQTQTWLFNQVSCLQQLGLVSHVACERTENLDQFEVANIHCFAKEPAWRQLWDRAVRRLRFRYHLDYMVQVGRKTKAQIVHSHFGNIGWSSLGGVRKLGVKHVVTFYGFDVNMLPLRSPMWRKRYLKLFTGADLVLCEGSHMASCIVALGCPAEKVKVQHLGVDVDRIEFRPRHWQSGEPLRVLIAASFREKKGIPCAIEALGMLQKTTPIELTIIGDAGANEASQREKKRIFLALEQSGLVPVTRLLGYQPHAQMLAEAYRNHIFLHPSVTAQDGDTEGGAPVGIIEMLASGMPVVSTYHCDIPEVLGPELHHLLAPENSSNGLVAVMNHLIAAPEMWKNLVSAGRARIEAEYSMHRQAEKLSGIYNDLLE